MRNIPVTLPHADFGARPVCFELVIPHPSPPFLPLSPSFSPRHQFTKRKKWANLLVNELSDTVVFVLVPSPQGGARVRSASRPLSPPSLLLSCPSSSSSSLERPIHLAVAWTQYGLSFIADRLHLAWDQGPSRLLSQGRREPGHRRPSLRCVPVVPCSFLSLLTIELIFHRARPPALAQLSPAVDLKSDGPLVLSQVPSQENALILSPLLAEPLC